MIPPPASHPPEADAPRPAERGDQPLVGKQGVRMIDQRLLHLLVCPVCKVGVAPQGETLQCPQCSRRYPVRDGIPIMLPEEAAGPPVEPEGPTR